MATDLTQGSVLRQLLLFSVPYFLACFLQTFYGIADLFIAGQYNGSTTITAIHIGSQIMHMVTLGIAGFAMGVTVLIGRAFGAKDSAQLSLAMGNSISLFAILAIIITGGSILAVDKIAEILQTPPEAFAETIEYTTICFAGIPLIAAYNVIASTCRGLGDSRNPLIFVACGGVVNILLDVILIGYCGLGATGAALATVIAQGATVAIAIAVLRIRKLGIQFSSRHLVFHGRTIRDILGVGFPTACQDGFIQICFLFITAIANARGLEVAASVGIVEKLICFFFLVPSAMLASISALVAQNRGAGLHSRGKTALRHGLAICSIYGLVIGILCQFVSPTLVGLFTSDGKVIEFGTQYLRSYGFDVLFAGIHFCFSGYFCAYNKAIWAFVHNVISSVTTRIPGTWIASVRYPTTLTPMGLAAPLGSILSALICVLVYRHYFRSLKDEPTANAES